jgi:hypothetical protein
MLHVAMVFEYSQEKKSGPQMKGWEVPKWGRLVDYNKYGLPVFIQVRV